MTALCDDIRVQLGAYALGTLEPADQQRVEAHLAGCEACLMELAELEAVVPALASVTAADLADPPQPSPDLFARIRSAVDASAADATRADAAPHTGTAQDAASGSVSSIKRPARERRPRRWLLAVAASVVLLAGAGTAIGITVSSSQPTSTVASGTNGMIRLDVAATDQGSGTRLELTAKGLPAHEHCHLVAVAKDGTRHDAGSWNATYDGEAQLTESTDVPRDQLRKLTLYGGNGQSLVVVRT